MHERSVLGFDDERKMRFWAYLDLIKSDKAKELLTKVCKRQKFFLEAIIQNYCSSILFLDTIPDGSSLPSFRTMILGIKSVQFPKISLFYSVDRM